jgi:hypothetical protein
MKFYRSAIKLCTKLHGVILQCHNLDTDGKQVIARNAVWTGLQHPFSLQHPADATSGRTRTGTHNHGSVARSTTDRPTDVHSLQLLSIVR